MPIGRPLLALVGVESHKGTIDVEQIRGLLDLPPFVRQESPALVGVIGRRHEVELGHRATVPILLVQAAFGIGSAHRQVGVPMDVAPVEREVGAAGNRISPAGFPST